MVSADVAIAECLDDRCCVRQPQPARWLELLFTSGPVFREEASTDEPGLALPSESLSVGLSVVTAEESASGLSVYTMSW